MRRFLFFRWRRRLRLLGCGRNVFRRRRRRRRRCWPLNWPFLRRRFLRSVGCRRSNLILRRFGRGRICIAGRRIVHGRCGPSGRLIRSRGWFDAGVAWRRLSDRVWPSRGLIWFRCHGCRRASCGLRAFRCDAGADHARSDARSNTGPGRRRRRRDSRNDRLLSERDRRLCGWRRYACSCGNVAGARGCKRRSFHDPGALKLFGSHANRSCLYGFRPDKSFARDGSHRGGVIRVRVVNAVDRHVVDDRCRVIGVVDIRYLRDVHHSRIAHIYVLHVRRAGVIGGQVHVAGS